MDEKDWQNLRKYLETSGFKPADVADFVMDRALLRLARLRVMQDSRAFNTEQARKDLTLAEMAVAEMNNFRFPA